MEGDFTGAKCNLDIFNPTIEYKLINSKLLKNISLPACRPISTYLASIHLLNKIDDIKSFTYLNT